MISHMARATIAATALSGASNIIAQLLEAYQSQRPFQFDAVKLSRFALVTCIDSPANYKWQQLLESTFPGHDPLPWRPLSSSDLEKQDGRGGRVQKPKLNLRNTIIKTVLDCTLGAVLNTVAFFILMGVLKRQPANVLWHNVRYETLGVITAGFTVWPLATLISFSCVRMEHRITFLSFISLVWGVYMSLVATRV
jgi:hypothetical protein